MRADPIATVAAPMPAPREPIHLTCTWSPWGTRVDEGWVRGRAAPYSLIPIRLSLILRLQDSRIRFVEAVRNRKTQRQVGTSCTHRTCRYLYPASFRLIYGCDLYRHCASDNTGRSPCLRRPSPLSQSSSAQSPAPLPRPSMS